MFPTEQFTSAIPIWILVYDRMAGWAQQNKIFKGVGFEIADRSFFVAWPHFTVRNYMSHFCYMLVAAHFSWEKRS